MTTISDPAQLLHRIPELEQFTSDVAIKRAIETGDPFKVYRALVLAKCLFRHKDKREPLNQLIKNRRLFSKPFKKVPSLFTINTAGLGFVGRSEKEEDGTYVALHAFVILFAIPLIPLGAYLVKETDSRKWTIYTRVPLGIIGWLYSRALSLLLVLLIGYGAYGAWHKSRNQDVIVLNGFTEPLQVTLGAQKQTVPAEGRVVFTVPVGQVDGVASTSQAGEIERLHQDIKSHAGLTIWNIAGATPLLKEDLTYYKTPPVNAKPDPQTAYCGQRFIELDKIDYEFDPPPRTISMGKYATVLTKTSLYVFKDATNLKATDICLHYLFNEESSKIDKAERPRELATLYTALAQLNHWKAELASTAIYFANQTSPDEAIKIAKQAAAAQPDDIKIQRLYQDTQSSYTDSAILLQEYKNRAQQQPDSVTSQYLYARLLDGVDGLHAMENLATKYKDDPNILRSLIWHQNNSKNFDGTITSYQHLKKIAPQSAVDTLEYALIAMVAKNQIPQALHEIEETYRQNGDENEKEYASDFALIAKRSNADPERLINELDKKYKGQFNSDLMRIRAGLKPKNGDKDTSVVFRLVQTLPNNPTQALQIADAAESTDFAFLFQEQIALLYCEALRTNDAKLAKKLQLITLVPTSTINALKQYVAGSNPNFDQTSINLTYQAAADLVRSRNASLSAKERAELRERAKNEDVLRTVITTAAQQWPA